jgi:hypothetical protein
MTTVRTCREPSCKAALIFVESPAGKVVPVDAETAKCADCGHIHSAGPDDNLGLPCEDEGCECPRHAIGTYHPDRHTSHFKTCTKPSQFTRRTT